MTLDELVQRFPKGCRVKMQQWAIGQGWHRKFRSSTGKVEGYWVHTDVAGNAFPTLILWLYGRNRREVCDALMWEREAGESPEGKE